jgi:1-acyl-sn-glycerol-3-phosphate acyltransferase
MNHFLMRVLKLFLWNGELVGEENLPRSGPAVFIANHLEAVGPIAAYCSIPFRLYA